MPIATVNLRFGVNLDTFKAGLSKIESEMGKLGTKMQSVGKSLSIGITLPVVALGAASLKAASDAEETFSKFDTVFSGVQKSAEEAFQTLRSEYGLSSLAAKDMLSSTGDLLTGFGFSQKAALDLSTDVNKLAVDLASFTNFEGGAAEASKALTSALLGEREAAKSLGIVITENEVKLKMAEMASEGFRFESEKQAKAQATFQLALDQSGNALGDYERTKMSAANQTRLFWARLEDLRILFGTHILPLFTKGVIMVNKLVEGFLNLPESTRKIIIGITGLAAAIGPLLTGLGFFTATIIPAMKAGLAALSVLFSPLVLKIAAVTAVVGGLILVGKGIIDSWDTVKTYFSQLWDKIKLFFMKGVAATLGVLNEFTSAIGIDFSGAVMALESKAKDMEKAMSVQPVVSFGDVVSEVGGNIAKTFSNIKESIVGSMSASKDAIDDTVDSAGNLGGGGINRTSDSGIQSDKNSKPGLSLPVIENVQGVTDRLREAAPAWYQAAQEMTAGFNQIINDGIINGLGTFSAGIGDLISGTASIGDVGKMLLGTLGGVMEQLGKMAIGTGIAVEAIKKALTSLGGIGAIAAGVALIALSKVVTSRVSKLGGGGSGGGSLGMGESVPGRAMGGSISAGVPYMVGERGPELIVPRGSGQVLNARQTAMGGGPMEIHVMGTLTGNGRDLVGVIDQTLRVSGRTS